MAKLMNEKRLAVVCYLFYGMAIVFNLLAFFTGGDPRQLVLVVAFVALWGWHSLALRYKRMWIEHRRPPPCNCRNIMRCPECGQPLGDHAAGHPRGT